MLALGRARCRPHAGAVAGRDAQPLTAGRGELRARSAEILAANAQDVAGCNESAWDGRVFLLTG